jgi:hypothetical protein
VGQHIKWGRGKWEKGENKKDKKEIEDEGRGREGRE